MSKCARRLCVLAGSVLVSVPAMADVPSALDRVPSEAKVVAAIRNLEDFQGRVGKLFKDLQIPTNEGEMATAFALMETPGVNKKGSMAIALLPEVKKEAGKADAKQGAGEDDMDEGPSGGPIVLIVPVSDYAAFVTGMKGKPGAGVVQLDGEKFGGDSAFCKDIGGGYAALGPVKEIVEKFDGKAGRLDGHKKMLGAVGTRVADKADTIIIANVPALAEEIKEGAKNASQQMEMMAMMAGPGGANMGGVGSSIQALSENFSRDAQVAVFGLGIDEGGVWMDMAAQFKEGSESAKYVQSKGKAGALSAVLPDQPFLFAMSVDTSAASIKALFKKGAEMNKAAAEQAPGMWNDMMKSLDTIDGASMVVGASPGALMGGLLANSVAYYKTAKPADYVKTMSDGMAAMNGKTVNGMTFKNTYQTGAATVAGVKVDKWSMQVNADPNDPNAAGAQQAMMMLNGPSGPGGFVAQVKDGVLMTMAPNQSIMTAAIEAQGGKKALGANAEMKGVAEKLQGDRTAELYIGVKSILDLVSGFMPGMAGNVPQNLAPIGMGASTSDSGGHVRIYVPTQVITTIKSVMDAANGGEADEMEEAPAEKGGQPPRF